MIMMMMIIIIIIIISSSSSGGSSSSSSSSSNSSSSKYCSFGKEGLVASRLVATIPTAADEELKKTKQSEAKGFLEPRSRIVRVVNIADQWDRFDCEVSVLSAYVNLSADLRVCTCGYSGHHTWHSI